MEPVISRFYHFPAAGSLCGFTTMLLFQILCNENASTAEHYLFTLEGIGYLLQVVLPPAAVHISFDIGFANIRPHAVKILYYTSYLPPLFLCIAHKNQTHKLINYNFK